MPDIDLSEFLTDSIPEGEEIPRPENDHEATVLLRRIGQLRKQISDATSLANAERGKVTEWEQTVNGPRIRQVEFFESLLKGYMEHVRNSTNGKVKSISLPTGIVKTTAAQPKWEIADTEAFIAWVAEQGIEGLTKVETKPATLKDLKARLQDDGDGNVITSEGELVPGLVITPPPAPFTIQINPSL